MVSVGALETESRHTKGVTAHCGNKTAIPRRERPFNAWSAASTSLLMWLPDQRHITGPRLSTGIMDTNCVGAVYLNVDLVGVVEVHDVGPRCATVP